MSARVVLLGAGFGGLELASRLSAELGNRVEVTLIDQADAFVFGFAKLDVMFGRRKAHEIRLPYSAIRKPHVRFRRERVVSIDPEHRRVVTNAATYDADVLVVALGADLAPERTVGFVESGYEFYSPEGAERLRDVLADFSGGSVIIGVLGGHFKCPPAPYEAAFMLHDYLAGRGIRARTRIQVITPMPKPIPVSNEVSQSILAALADRGIEHRHGTWIDHLDPQSRTAHLRDGAVLAFDLFLGVPRHVAPLVVRESGMTEADGWIAVDSATLETRWRNVFAVGDVASAPVPRAGVIAEGEASTVADVLIHRIAGGPAAAPYPGLITCFIEMGDDLIGRVDVDFLGGPRPRATFMPASLEGAQQKREFARTRRERWFGLS